MKQAPKNGTLLRFYIYGAIFSYLNKPNATDFTNVSLQLHRFQWKVTDSEVEHIELKADMLWTTIYTEL